MSQLPKGWERTTLGKIGKWSSGGTPKRTNKDYYDGDIPWLVIGDLNDGLVKSSKNSITNLGLENSSAKLVEPNTLLIAMYGSIGKLGINLMPCATNQAIAACKIDETIIEQKFLFYYLMSQRRNLLSQGKGGAQQNISQTVLKAYDIALPNLEEQKRIAEKLDSVLAKVEAAQARLDKIPIILKRFRQSVLAAATSGELTKDWREENGKTMESWQSKSIEELTLKSFDGPFGSKLKTADYTDEGIKVARLENIGHMYFKTEKETFVSEQKFEELKKHELLNNDILFSSFVDEEIRVCKFSASYGKHINKADCFCLRPNTNVIIPDLLVYKLASRSTYELAKEQVHGATRPRVNLRFLKSLQLPIPNIVEQVVLVERIESLFEHANTVEKQYNAAKARLDKLTQSILAKAFRGELVKS